MEKIFSSVCLPDWIHLAGTAAKRKTKALTRIAVDFKRLVFLWTCVLTHSKRLRHRAMSKR